MAERPARYSVTVDQGVTFRRLVTYRQPNGNPRDLTGWVATLDVRPGRRPGAAIAVFDSENDPEVVACSAAEGRILVTIPAAVAAELAPGLYRYTLDVTSPSGDVVRLLRGNITVRAK